MEEAVFNRLALDLVDVNKEISTAFSRLQQAPFCSTEEQQLEQNLVSLCKKRISISKRLAKYFDSL
jgi:hypothetical protein